MMSVRESLRLFRRCNKTVDELAATEDAASRSDSAQAAVRRRLDWTSRPASFKATRHVRKTEVMPMNIQRLHRVNDYEHVMLQFLDYSQFFSETCSLVTIPQNVSVSVEVANNHLQNNDWTSLLTTGHWIASSAASLQVLTCPHNTKKLLTLH